MRFFQKIGIGRTSIKESIDNLPNGICFADKEGIVVLCNRQMHRLCYVLMGMDLQHICELRNALKNPRSEIVAINPSMFVYLFPDGRVWQFSECALMDSDGRAYTQMQAVEITMLYEKKAELQKENTALNEANARAKKLYSELDRIVREEESFAVKAHVHDEVGLLLLSSRKLLKQPQSNLVELQRIGKMWSKMAKTLGLPEQAEGKALSDASGKALRELEEAIAGIGVKLTMKGRLPQNSHLTYLLIVAIRECATNTVRHARGNEIMVELSETDRDVCATITNNGKAPESTVIEGGGLGALRRRIENAGGNMRVESTPIFRFSLTLPRSI